MTFHLTPHQRRGLAAFALAILAGAGAPLAAALPQAIALAAPKPQTEIARTLMIACPRPSIPEPGDHAAPWLSRCGLLR